MTTLFISDLHLDAAAPEITGQFHDFLAREATTAEALYILGDLFEVWVGDDDDDPHHAGIIAALGRLTESGTPGYFMHGNRDFLIGERFATMTGFTLLPDPSPVDLYGHDVLLSHGDRYCTDDVEYQAFRKQSRDPGWQAAMLALPLAERRAVARNIKAESNAATAGKSMEIMDVNAAAVAGALSDAGVAILLHGHTHRPAVHRLPGPEGTATRIVLGDWYTQGSVLRWDATGYDLAVLARP